MKDRFEESQLDNILIDRDQNRFDKIKKIILLVASLALLFTLSIIVIKILNQDDKREDLTNKLPTEAIAQKDIKEPEPLFERLPIKEEGSIDDKFDKIVSDIKLQAEEEMKVAKSEIDREIEKVDTTHQMLFTPEPITEKNVVSTPTSKPIIQDFKPIVETKAQDISTPTPKPIKTVEEIKVEIEPTKSPTISSISSDIPKGYYIQVGAFKNVKELYLQNISQKGFNFQLEKSADITKVLIGPYIDKTEARNDLIKVKEQIAQGSYLTSKYNK